MEFRFSGEIFEWRGPAPHHFIALPEGPANLIREAASVLTYGWGVIPVRARIGGTDFTTSLFPKNGGYLLPVKLAVRRHEGIGTGDIVDVLLTPGA